MRTADPETDPAADLRHRIRAHLDIDPFALVPGTHLETLVIRHPGVRAIVAEWLAERGDEIGADTVEAIEEHDARCAQMERA